jgi:hypothetical protein
LASDWPVNRATLFKYVIAAIETAALSAHTTAILPETRGRETGKSDISATATEAR